MPDLQHRQPVPPHPLTAPPAHSWTTEMGLRMRHHLVLKALGISAFMWVFFGLYFYLLRHPASVVTVMPLTALDRSIPFQPGLLWAYASLWLYVGVAPGLMLSLREVLVYGLWMGGLCATGLLMFYLWPTAVPVPDIAPDLARHPGFVMLQGVDAAGNACPSLHVATATLTALWIHHLLRGTGAPAWAVVANGLWLALIVYSTLAIKQHVVLDALAGAALALLFAWPSLRWHPPALRAPVGVALLKNTGP